MVCCSHSFPHIEALIKLQKGDDYAVWNYGYFIEEDKKFAYRELAEKVYPKRMDDYRKFMKHLKLSYCESASS